MVQLRRWWGYCTGDFTRTQAHKAWLFQMYLALVRPHIPHDVFVPWTITLRSSSKLLYHLPFTHTNAFLHSFVPKTCSVWNNIPDYITHANTLSVLNSSLGNFYMYHVNSQ